MRFQSEARMFIQMIPVAVEYYKKCEQVFWGEWSFV